MMGQQNPERMFPADLIARAPWVGDPGLTETHLRGRRLLVPAGTQFSQIGGGVTLDRTRNLKFILGCQIPDSVPLPGGNVPTAQLLSYKILTTVESDEIPKIITVPANFGNPGTTTFYQTGGQTVYAEARAFRIFVSNPCAVDLFAYYGISEQATATPNQYTTFEAIVNGAPRLTVPAYCQSINFQSLPGNPGAVLEGWDSGGVLVYQEPFAGPRSPEIPLCPGLGYRLNAAVGFPCFVTYNCIG